jgi:hypothetical protein
VEASCPVVVVRACVLHVFLNYLVNKIPKIWLVKVEVNEVKIDGQNKGQS